MKIAALVAAMGLAAVANAQIVFTGSPVSQNFDGLPTTAIASAVSSTIGTVYDVSGAAGWKATKISGTGTAATPFAVDNGAGTSGGLYSYGASGSPTPTERALGVLASGSNVLAFGAVVQNNAADAIDSFTLTFNREMWRSSTTNTNILAFAWGVSTGGAITDVNFLTSTALTANTGGDIQGLSPVTTNGAVNGNVAPNQALVTVTISLVTPLPVGDKLYLRWSDVNETGNDAGLAIDDFNFSATVIPTPGSAALVTIGGLVAARRRRA